MELKEKIIHEALRQISVKGYMATSTADIIKACGTSKGGLYNHFKSKELLFLEVLSYARKIWRERNIEGLEHIDRPLDKIKYILSNYRDRYLIDSDSFPGGCIFINLTMELSDQHPHLAAEVSTGFARLKAMFKRMLDQEKEIGNLKDETDIEVVVEMLFSGLLGSSVMYTADKSKQNLNRSINALIEYLNNIIK